VAVVIKDTKDTKDTKGRRSETLVFRLWDAHGRQIAKVTAQQVRTHPETLRREAELEAHLNRGMSIADQAAERYPTCTVITVNGVTEVIEHRRMEPLFYVSDDEKLRAEAGLSRR
jgi:hypothetical protein